MARKSYWMQKLLRRSSNSKAPSWLERVVAGSMYRISDMRGDTDVATIKTQIDVMRALARDSQVSTALAYYATDATTVNTAGQIIWATSDNDDCAEIVNQLFKRWKVNDYARDHILELATIGNLYIPTTSLYRDWATPTRQSIGVGLDLNQIPDPDFDIIPSSKVPPENVIHLYDMGQPCGYMVELEDVRIGKALQPEESIIHFSLGGLLGDYTLQARNNRGEIEEYDIKFAQPLMERAAQPTQTLGLLEDALVLSSLIRTVKFINVECGNAEEEEVQVILQNLKATIENQISLNTSTGDTQSYMNPQSPNNIIYLPKIKGQDAISITDLNMAEASDADSKLLNYYLDKKLSVLGVPKEAMNFSSNEGLGGAGSVLSQRSALYANSLQRLKTAYMQGWTDAINTYFTMRGMSGLVDKFQLHMSEIVTQQSTITFEKRDSAISQASQVVDLLKNLGVTNADDYKTALTEILTEVLPMTASEASGWDMEVSGSEGGDMNV